MRTLNLSLTIITIVLALSSCNSGEDTLNIANSQDKDFEVVRLSDYCTSASRSNANANIASDQILKFKDQESYNRTLLKVKEMNDSSKREFFKEIGFEGAYTILNQAEDELDNAFDLAEMTDSLTGINIILDCVAKYDGVLTFNSSDTTDVTPSLPFNSENAELLGNIDGKIMIGEKILTPNSTNPSPAYNGSFIKYKAEVKVKNGKYTSYFRLGRIGVNVAFQLETYRKFLFFKKSDKKCGYDGKLLIYSNGKSNGTAIHCGQGNWTLYTLASIYSPRINMTITNFSSTRNSKNKVTKSINNILVK